LCLPSPCCSPCLHHALSKPELSLPCPTSLLRLQLGVSEWREDRQYDVVTCMFAIHYFFVTEQALKQVGRADAACTLFLAVMQGCFCWH